MKEQRQNQRRQHRSRSERNDPNAAKRKLPTAKYAEVFGIAYTRGGIRARHGN